MDKKTYIQPQMDVIRFASEDVITTSGAVEEPRPGDAPNRDDNVYV